MNFLAEHQDVLFSYFVGVVILAPLLAAAMIVITHALEKRRERLRQRRGQADVRRVRATAR